MSSPSANSTENPVTIDAAPATTIPAVEAIDKILEDYEKMITSWKTSIETVKANLKEATAIKTALTRVRRDVDKGLRKKTKTTKRISDPTKPTGFKKPIDISEDLAKFLKVDSSTKMSRTDVTKAINQYIKDNDLQDPQAKRNFDLNKSPAGKALLKLLNPSGDAPVSYFNLQRWLAPHFPKPAVTADSSPSPPAASDAPPPAPARRRAPARKA